MGPLQLFKDRNLLSTGDSKIMRNNIAEIRALVDSEHRKNRMKTNHRDIVDFGAHLGGYDGIIYLDGILKELEETLDRQGMQDFINRVTERLEK